MVNDFSKLVARLHILEAAIPKNVALMMRKVALVIDQALVVSTPVDEGPARSNWVVTIGSPFSREIAAYSPGSNMGIGESANKSAALQQGQQVVARYTLGQGAIFITNNKKYIGALNTGHSPQAKPGFIERAVDQGNVVMRSGRVRIIS